MMNDFEFYEENDLFFHRLGECKLASDGRSCSTSLARKSGIIFVGCDTGLYCLDTATLEQWLQKVDNSDEAKDLASIFQAHSVEPVATFSCDISQVSLSHDESLLFVTTGSKLKIFLAQNLATDNGQQDQPVWVTDLLDAILNAAWDPTVDSGRLAVLTESGKDLRIIHTQNGKDGGGTERESLICSGVTSFAWSPGGGSRLAFGGDDWVQMYDCPSSSLSKKYHMTCYDQQDGEDLILQVDGLVWLENDSILVSCTAIFGEDDASALILHPSWGMNGVFSGTEGDLEIFELQLTFLPAGYTIGQQRLVGDTLSDWNVAILAHQSISDQHIRPFICKGSKVVYESVTDDKLSIRIPNAPNDADNFVKAIHFDLTTGPSCPHPLDNNAPLYSGLPRIWILTSDGMIRCYIVGSVNNLPSCTADRVPIPKSDVVFSSIVVPATQTLQAGLETDLPSDDDFEEEEDESRQDSQLLLETSGMSVNQPRNGARETGVLLRSSTREIVVPESTPEETVIPYPVAALECAGRDFPRIEREFLEEIHQSRKIEHDSHQLMSELMASMKLDELREATRDLLDKASHPIHEIAKLRSLFENIVVSMDEAYSRMDAMPLFSTSRSAMERSKTKPLDHSLDIVKQSAKRELKELKFRCEELRETIATIQALQKSTDSSRRTSKISTLQESLASLSSFIQTQIDRVDSAWSIAGSKGLISLGFAHLNRNGVQIDSLQPDDHVHTLLHVSPQHDRPNWVSMSPTVASSRSNFIAGNSPDKEHADSSTFSREILNRCRTTRGLRRTVVSMPRLPESKAQPTSLPQLQPLKILKEPEPLSFSLHSNVPGGKSATSQPPLPTFALQAQSKSLVEKAGVTKAAEPAKAATSQPPLPTFALQAQSKSLVEKAGVTKEIEEDSKQVTKGLLPEPATQSEDSKITALFSTNSQERSLLQGDARQSSPFGQVSTSSQPSAVKSPPAFGQPSGFGQPSTFGQPVPSSSPFGQVSTSSQPSAVKSPPAFGQPSGFGQPSTFGQPIPSSSPFGQVSTSSQLSAAKSPPAFGQASAFGQPSAFGQGASTASVFSSIASQGTGFASFANSGAQTAFGSAPQPLKPTGNSSMWQARK